MSGNVAVDYRVENRRAESTADGAGGKGEACSCGEEGVRSGKLDGCYQEGQRSRLANAGCYGMISKVSHSQTWGPRNELTDDIESDLSLVHVGCDYAVAYGAVRFCQYGELIIPDSVI